MNQSAALRPISLESSAPLETPMLHTALTLAMPLKMLSGMESGRLCLYADDYHRLAGRVLEHLEALETGELIAVARGGPGLLAEMAEQVVFDRACCLVIGDRQARLDAERAFEALISRLLSPPARPQ